MYRVKSFKQFLNEFEIEGSPMDQEYKKYIDNGNLSFMNTDLAHLPLCPEKWDGMVVVMFNDKLTSLEGLPKHVEKAVTIMMNPKLKNLKGSPETVNNSFNASNNGLVSLEGAPRICKQFKCIDNDKDFTKRDVKNTGVNAQVITLS